MRRYRFFYYSDGRRWYYTEREFVALWGHAKPGIFTDSDWEEWGNDGRNEREEIGEDEAMRLQGAPMLPGLEG